jgi:hypothetical protein
MDYRTLQTLRHRHPAWRLLVADHAPLVVSFLHDTYIKPNVRTLSQPELATRLEDYLYSLRAEYGDEEMFPREAQHYLDTWASDEHAWLRKYYPAGSDEVHYDLTSATERAIDWVVELGTRRFVGTESRLMAIFDLLHQLVQGTELDPWVRVSELERRRQEIEAEIQQIRDGQLYVFDATRIRERFHHIATSARGLLSDFREVEQNFRDLDRSIREKIATWDGGKAVLLDEIFGERDAIADSDQGKSFRAFWDFLMSPSRQSELSQMLERVFSLDPVKEMKPDRRLTRIHYDWVQAGEATQRTVARLSEQLRRYLDDKAWQDNRRIMKVVRDIEHHALALRDAPPTGRVTDLEEAAPDISLIMDRPLFVPPLKLTIDEIATNADEDVPSDALFTQVYVDKQRLSSHVRRALQTRTQVSLADVIEAHPLEQGLAELVTYLSLAATDGTSIIDDGQHQTMTWTDEDGTVRQGTMPLVVFCRQAAADKRAGKRETTGKPR